MVRQRDDKSKLASISDFGMAADGPKPDVMATPPAATSKAKDSEESVPTSMLLYFRGDKELPLRISRLAISEDRSKHQIAIRALKLGLEELERQVSGRSN